jgi:hypothetical protein
MDFYRELYIAMEKPSNAYINKNYNKIHGTDSQINSTIGKSIIDQNLLDLLVQEVIYTESNSEQPGTKISITSSKH